MSETHYADFDGHRVAYRVAGEGPALVVLHLYRRREDLIHLRLLSDRRQVFEIAPLGFGRSDRVPGYAGEALPDQILAVLDHYRVDRFVVWGYSAGGAMAACIARGTPRAAAFVCGGFALLGGVPTDGAIKQMDRRLPPDHPSRTLWTWVKSLDWAEELKTMPPGLFYWGSEDTSVQMAKRLRRSREQLVELGVDCVEFAGLGHADVSSDDVLSDAVFPTVVDWVARRLGPSW